MNTRKLHIKEVPMWKIQEVSQAKDRQHSQIFTKCSGKKKKNLCLDLDLLSRHLEKKTTNHPVTNHALVLLKKKYGT